MKALIGGLLVLLGIILVFFIGGTFDYAVEHNIIITNLRWFIMIIIAIISLACIFIGNNLMKKGTFN